MAMEESHFVDDGIFTKNFQGMEQYGSIVATYIWLGGQTHDIRSKARTLTEVPQSPDELPVWNFDGSSTGQAPGNDSEVLLRPVRIFRDPFLGAPNIVVLADCIKPDGTPIDNNTRHACNEAMEKCKAQKPWFGIEQEYSLMTRHGRPLGWPQGGFPGAQGPYYCGNGADRVYGRSFSLSLYKCCLYAGVKISGTNAEVMPSQWEYQVGPCEGIEMGDHLWMARWIQHRLGELFRLTITFDPKVISGDWNGAGCHTNFSTKETREKGGLKVIMEMAEKLRKNHAKHIAGYGEGNERRMTGKHETSSIDVFSVGVADRGASVRIPRAAEKDGCGYFEDRRPASNIDPYVVTQLMVETCCLDM